MKMSQFIISILLLCSFNAKIDAQELTMFQGFFGYQYYQDDIEISKTEVNSLMQEHDLTKTYWNKSVYHKKYAFIALGTQLATAYLAIRSGNNNLNPTVTGKTKLLLAASITSALVGVGFSFSSASLKKKAILGYNKLQSKEDFLYYLGQTNNGIGIVCSF